jgi:hypothetical protein
VKPATIHFRMDATANPSSLPRAQAVVKSWSTASSSTHRSAARGMTPRFTPTISKPCGGRLCGTSRRKTASKPSRRNRQHPFRNRITVSPTLPADTVTPAIASAWFWFQVVSGRRRMRILVAMQRRQTEAGKAGNKEGGTLRPQATPASRPTVMACQAARSHLRTLQPGPQRVLRGRVEYGFSQSQAIGPLVF